MISINKIQSFAAALCPLKMPKDYESGLFIFQRIYLGSSLKIAAQRIPWHIVKCVNYSSASGTSSVEQFRNINPAQSSRSEIK
jgi:hypothetical protein